MEHFSFNTKPLPPLLSHSEHLVREELATLRRTVPVVLPALLLMQPGGGQLTSEDPHSFISQVQI